MPILPLFENKPLNTEAISSIRHLLENRAEKGSRELVEGLNQLSQNPTCTMPASLANTTCFELHLITQIHVQNQLINSTLNPGIRPLQTGKSAPKSHRILLEINDWVLRHAFAAGFQKPDNTIK